MNILKRLNYIVLALGFVVFTACEDDFNQDDLLELQQTQLDAAIASLNNSGQFASAIVQVVTFGGDPVSGATVTLLTAGDSTSGGGAQTATTDASGVATFSSVVAGGNWFSVTSADHIGVSGTADIGSINYEILNGNVVPIKVTGSAVIALFPTTSTDLATINGQVLIQTNMTTAAKEPADNVAVKAALNPGASWADNSGGGNLEGAGNFIIESLSFYQSETGIGTATTDSLGYYTMQVPAPADAEVQYELVYPEIERDQVLAITSRNGVYLGGIQLDTVATTFGVQTNGGGGHFQIATYNGFNITVSEPPVPGRGLGLTFTRQTRAWNPSTWGLGFRDATVDDGAVVQITGLGAGYTGSPQVDITDATGNDWVAEAHIELAITSLTATGTLTGFGADVTIPFTGEYDSPFWDLTNGDVDTTNDVALGTLTLNVQTNASGEITQDSVNAAVSAAISNGDTYFDASDLDAINDWVVSLRLDETVNSTATLTLGGATSRLNDIDVWQQLNTSGSSNAYTGPSVALSGGGATTQATISVTQFSAPYLATPDNSNNTQGYLLLPSSITYEYTTPVAGATQADPVLAAGGTAWDVLDPNGAALLYTATSFTNAFEINSADSTVIVNNLTSGITIRTVFSSVSTPTAIIQERREECAQWPTGVDATISKNGQITAMSLSTSYGLTTLNNDVEVAIIQGSGYISAPTITISAVAGLPGSGATLYISGNYQSDGEFTIQPGTLSVLNPGSGYLTSANAFAVTSTFDADASGDTFVNVSAGDVVNVTYDYNTGYRSEAVY